MLCTSSRQVIVKPAVRSTAQRPYTCRIHHVLHNRQTPPMICKVSAFQNGPKLKAANHQRTFKPALSHSASRVSCHRFQRLFSPGHERTGLKCSASIRDEPKLPRNSQQPKPREFPQFVGQQAFAAAGSLLLLVFLIRPLAKSWQTAHKLVPDALPAAVWLPRSTSDPPAKQHAQCQDDYQSKPFAAISSSIPATSSRLLRITDACLMQLTVTLQQVRTICKLRSGATAPLHMLRTEYVI